MRYTNAKPLPNNSLPKEYKSTSTSLSWLNKLFSFPFWSHLAQNDWIRMPAALPSWEAPQRFNHHEMWSFFCGCSAYWNSPFVALKCSNYTMLLLWIKTSPKSNFPTTSGFGDLFVCLLGFLLVWGWGVVLFWIFVYVFVFPGRLGRREQRELVDLLSRWWWLLLSKRFEVKPR